MKRLLPSRRLFGLWLERRENKLVGQSGGPCYCPLARFLKDTQYTGNSDLEVTSTIVDPDPWNSDPIELPKWAQKFVAAVDAFGRIELSGKDALTVLRRIK